jgi:hypothetical protein
VKRAERVTLAAALLGRFEDLGRMIPADDTELAVLRNVQAVGYGR